MKRCVLFALLLSLALTGCAHRTEAPSQQSSFAVTVLKTGKSDAIFVACDGQSMLIDTAEQDDTDKLKKHARQSGISPQILVLTHLDKDHVGGAAAAVDAFAPRVVYQAAYTTDSAEYTAFRSACDAGGIAPVALRQVTEFALGSAKVRLLPAARTDYADKNDYSVMITVQYGDTSFLFAGDALEERLNEFLQAEAAHFDVVKIPHHGRLGSYAKQFVAATTPKIAVITCSDKNPPSDTVLSYLKDSEVYLTADGTVTLTSDGTTVTVNQ